MNTTAYLDELNSIFESHIREFLRKVEINLLHKELQKQLSKDKNNKTKRIKI